MGENLKVNSKSSILEFKRKHNLLVEKVNEMDISTLVVALSQIVGSGNDAYTSTPYIRFTPTAEQEEILENEKNQIIKLDLSALGDSAPAPYIWIKRNTKVKILTYDALQFSCGGEQFWYDNYETDIAIKNVGNGALVYVPTLHTCDITLASISIPDLYAALGNINKLKLWKHTITTYDQDDNGIKLVIISYDNTNASATEQQFGTKIKGLFENEKTIRGRVYYNNTYKGEITFVGTDARTSYCTQGNTSNTNWTNYVVNANWNDVVTEVQL